MKRIRIYFYFSLVEILNKLKYLRSGEIDLNFILVILFILLNKGFLIYIDYICFLGYFLNSI